MYQKPKPTPRKTLKLRYIIVPLLAIVVGAGVYMYMTNKDTTVAYDNSSKQLAENELPSMQKPTRPEVDAYELNDKTQPIRMFISRLGVVAKIIPVESKDGFPAFSANIYDVAWEKSSATPASKSGIIIIGGYEKYDKSTGALEKIKSLGVGDSIIIELADGVKSNFSVTGLKQISSDESAQKTLRADPPSDAVELRIVTNAGDIIPTANGYQTRTIVIAKKQG